MLTPEPVALRQDLTIWASRSVRRLKPNQWMHKSAQELADVWIIWIIASSIDAQELPAGHLHERCTHSPADTPEMLQCTDTWSNTGQIRHNKNPSLNVDRIHSLSAIATSCVADVGTTVDQVADHSFVGGPSLPSCLALDNLRIQETRFKHPGCFQRVVIKLDILDRCARFNKRVTRRAPTWHCLGKMINRRLKN